MAKVTRFLPESLSRALKNIAARGGGLVILTVGLVLIVALLFRNSYLAGINAASSFGNAGFFENIANFFAGGIGWIPSLFLFLYIVRWGVVITAKWDIIAPEYNLMRAFIAVCVGAAGFGAVIPNSSFGGILGAIVAHDIGMFAGGWTVLFGIAFLCLFFFLAGSLLRIKWRNVRAVFKAFAHAIKWIATALHLRKPDIQDYDQEYEYDDDEPAPSPRKKSRPAVKKSSPRKAAAEEEVLEFELPPPEFLEKSNFSKTAVTPELRRNASALESHFEEFGVRGKVVGIKPGPIVTLYEFEPDTGMRIAKITDTVKDMTRAMAAENIRIAHIPRTNYIGVEMVNLDRQTIRFRGLVDSPDFINSRYHVPLALGVDIGGNSMYFDLTKMPHVLIAGRTGSGKSVFVQSIIMSILYHFTPDECKLVVIDPKGVDFTLWHDIPHLATPIVTDASQAVNVLKWAVREMEYRYKKLKDVGVQNLEGYNDAVRKLRASGKTITKQVPVGADIETGELEFEEQEIDLSDMPYLVVIIDEVADLMSVARKEVEACVQRLAQKARAAGIHVVAATQRPDTTVITGVIKANFPTRISFQARSAIDSGTTLGEKGAEQLLNFGDMLFSEAGRVPVRIHGAWIENKEINRVADFLRAQAEPEYIDSIDECDDDTSAASSVMLGLKPSRDEKDGNLYRQAVETVVRDKKPTISYIQRRLGIGYNKAATFIERMEADGIVSAPDANNKRHIL